MNEDNSVKCPSCDSEHCLWGKLERNDPDDYFSGKFYPSYIKKPGLFRIPIPGIDLAENTKIYACYECGHLWSTLNLEQYKSVIVKAGWEGGRQISPAPRKPYASWISSFIIGGLILFIAFLEYQA